MEKKRLLQFTKPRFFYESLFIEREEYLDESLSTNTFALCKENMLFQVRRKTDPCYLHLRMSNKLKECLKG
jgi:hypothetical protein